MMWGGQEGRCVGRGGGALDHWQVGRGATGATYLMAAGRREEMWGTGEGGLTSWRGVGRGRTGMLRGGRQEGKASGHRGGAHMQVGGPLDHLARARAGDERGLA